MNTTQHDTSKDPRSVPLEFKTGTARLLQRSVAGSRHDAFISSDGAICLFCVSKTSGGGVAVNENAFLWLREQEGPSFIRMKNDIGRVDIVIPLTTLPDKPVAEGKFGRYRIYDREDLLGGSEFPPLATFEEPL